MQNYHKHSCGSNIYTPDSAVFPEAYAKRAVELGHKVLSSVEHGWQGKYHEYYELAKKYDLKFIFGTEAYWVLDRITDDKTNAHIILLAKNENGRQAINETLSIANETGYYYKPRVDLELLLSLPPSDIFVTTACVAFWQFPDIEYIVRRLHDHFGSSFMLEIQYHNTDKQKLINSKIKEYAKKYGIEMIVGLDSHYIYPEQAQERDELLASSNIHYEDEDGWFMDYPDDDTVLQRFLTQGIFSQAEIQRAMNNTDALLSFEDYDSPVFNAERKLPTIYPGETQAQKDKRYSVLVSRLFKEYMKSVPPEDYQRYFDGIKMEVQTYKETGMTDYPLMDYAIVKRGIEKGGVITSTGRGCFTKDALVHTDTALKSIADVSVGESVVDMHGHFKKVIDTMKYHIREDMVQIDYLYGETKAAPNICTLDHKILIYRNGVTDWVEAAKIKQGDYVCLPKVHFENKHSKIIDLNDYNIFGYEFDENYIYEYSPFCNNEYPYSPRDISRKLNVGKSIIEKYANGLKDDFPSNPKILKKILDYVPFGSTEEYRTYIKNMRTTKIRRYIDLDYEFGQFIGLMYGDGCNSRGKNEVSLAINAATNKNIINRKIFENIALRFGLRVSERAAKNRNLTQISFRSKLISRFISLFLFTSDLGKQKQFNPELFYFPDVVKSGIANGLFLSDGHNGERKSFDNTSESLINAYKLLSLESNGTITGIFIRESGIDNRNYNRKKSYKLRHAANPYECPKPRERCLQNENYIFLPIKKITVIPDMETDVYDLTIEDSHSYLINNMIVHNSAVGFMTNTLCGFSKVDRFRSPIKLYPERFISKTRIIESNSLPDIDMNVAAQEPFEEAQREILGEDHAYPMIAFGTLKKKAAFKMYARAQNLDFAIANKISDQISRYDEAMKYADDDERDSIDIYQFVDEEYHDYVRKSQAYWGIIKSKAKAPCAYLLYQGSIRREIGLIRCKSESTKREYITTVIDGAVAENYKFLKNDWLIVDTVYLTDAIFKRCKEKPLSVNELTEIVKDNEKVWRLYAEGFTIGINQCEKPNAVKRLMRYQPKNVSELSAFIAAIRPGFKSMYSTFESRQPFSYGIPALDNIIQTEQFPYSFILYQEQLMSVLNLAGFPMDECYGIIKAIAKKHPEKVRPLKARFIEGFKKQIEGQCPPGKTEDDVADQVWTIIDNSTSYSFNSAHAYSMALDSLYNAYQKAYHPYEFYEVLMQRFSDKGKKDKVAALKVEMKNAFGIKEGPIRFGTDNRAFKADPENNQILPSLLSIKGLNKKCAEYLYSLSQQKEYSSFVDLLFDIKAASKANAKQLETLICLDYFHEFGNPHQLLKQLEYFDKFGAAKQLTKTDVDPIIPHDVMLSMCDKETEKKYVGINTRALLQYLAETTNEIKTPITAKLQYEFQYLGFVKTVLPSLSRDYAFVLDIVGKFGNKTLLLHRLKDGTQLQIKVKKKTLELNPIESGVVLNMLEIKDEPKWGKDSEGNWFMKSETEPILKKYAIIT